MLLPHDARLDIVNRLDVTHECDGRTDRRTDVIIANAALHYVGRPLKIKGSVTRLSVTIMIVQCHSATAVGCLTCDTYKIFVLLITKCVLVKADPTRLAMSRVVKRRCYFFEHCWLLKFDKMLRYVIISSSNNCAHT